MNSINEVLALSIHLGVDPWTVLQNQPNLRVWDTRQTKQTLTVEAVAMSKIRTFRHCADCGKPIRRRSLTKNSAHREVVRCKRCNARHNHKKYRERLKQK